MMMDESFMEDKRPFLPSMQAITSQSDDYIRHRMSDMYVSQHPTKALSPLEPSYSYSRRGSATDPAAFHNPNFRRPSITDMPLPNPTTAMSRRGSIATTADYDYSSRSPSPSSKRYHENDAAAPHPYALPNNNLLYHHPSNINTSHHHPYDPYQRRHSIATAEPSYNFGGRHSVPSSTKFRAAFNFPATIQESPNYRTYSAPPSPPQSALGNVGNQGLMHENKESKYNRRKNSMSRLSSKLSSRRRPSILDDLNDGPSAKHLLVRRASMPVVTSLHRHPYDVSGIPPPPPLPQQLQQTRLHKLRSQDVGEPHTSSRRGSMSDSMMEEDEEEEEEEEEGEKRKETPYSRSPELRISHKLAERKRRKEMKDLFDELRDSLPAEKNMKTSKWEILSKAVEYISLLKRRDYDMDVEISALRREIDMIKQERHYGPPFA